MRKLFIFYFLFIVSCISLFARGISVTRESLDWVKTTEVGQKKFTNEEKEQIKELLFETYAGKDTISSEGFDNIETYSDLLFYLKDNKVDNHFSYTLYDEKWHQFYEFSFFAGDNRNENSIFSLDTIEDKKYISTKNAEYIRMPVHVDQSDVELTKKVTGKKKFVILDYRSNWGGSDNPAILVLDKLAKKNWKGTVIILQDGNCTSAGEPTYMECNPLFSKLKFIIVGQNTLGAQEFVCPTQFKVNDYVYLSIPIEKGALRKLREFGIQCKYWLGEGKGFKPDVWINNNDEFIPYLNSIGIDTTGIEIR